MTSRTSKHQIWLVWLPILILVLATAWIRISGLDMEVQRAFWDSGMEQWIHKKNPFLTWVYGFGVVPALAVGIASLGLLLGGIGRADLAKYRKISGYFLLVLLLGSGLITNILLKGTWGRPRPSQVEEFGGVYPFESILVFDLASSGKSFPCGHATMGFFFFAVALAIPRRYVVRRWTMAGFALVLGGLLGLARVAQGGHFLSDVIWAAALMWFVAYALFHWMKFPDTRLFVAKNGFQKQVPLWAWALYVPVLFIGLLLALLGTPYQDAGTVHLAADEIKIIRLEGEGDFFLSSGDSLAINYQAEGFGVPNSKLRFQNHLCENGTFILSPYRKGFFTELRTKITVIIPENSDVKLVDATAKKRLIPVSR